MSDCSRSLRIDGWNVRVDQMVVIAWASPETVCLVGCVARITRIRKYDEETGELVKDPEVWILDARTDRYVGPIRREWISSIYPIDGAWATPEEVEEMLEGR